MFLLVAIGTTATLGALGQRYTTTVPGAAYDTGSLSISGAEKPGLLMMTVDVRRASVLDLVRAWLHGERLERFQGSASSRTGGQETFAVSRRHAWVAAHRCLDLELDAVKPSHPRAEA